MRRIFWLICFLGTYLWMMSTGKEHLILTKGKAIYSMIILWLEDADIDFQLDPKQTKKKSQRWD